jgi:hypothetical protein
LFAPCTIKKQRIGTNPRPRIVDQPLDKFSSIVFGMWF